jgi:Uma2 family endonuclease
MGVMTWDDVLADPSLQDLPYKIELNRAGRIEMSPASNQHGLIRIDIGVELHRRPGGRAIAECSVLTTDGVRVADVAWISEGRWSAAAGATPLPTAPEVCVEIMSPSNTWADMHRKAALYLEAGAEEVWIQTLDGQRSVIEPPRASSPP